MYRQLELESIKLFRFEIENVELARIIWNDEITFEELQKNTNKLFQVLQHICQTLNLFEMTILFKRTVLFMKMYLKAGKSGYLNAVNPVYF